jgi:hypothetical protein
MLMRVVRFAGLFVLSILIATVVIVLVEMAGIDLARMAE